MEARPHQRGRAGLQFLGSLSAVAATAGKRVVADAQAIAAARTPVTESGEAKLAEAAALSAELRNQPPYSWWSFLNRFGSGLQGQVAVDAFDEMSGDLKAQLDTSNPAWGTVEVSEGFAPPDGYLGYEFHLMVGGWDGHPHMGFIHRELIRPFVFEQSFKRRPGGGDPQAQKRKVAALAPKSDYRRILDVGTGTGPFLEALGETYPGAELYGIDMSPTMLRYAHQRAGVAGQCWHLKAAAAHDTGFEDASFDLVTTFVVLHEIPQRAIRATLREFRRILAPGGTLLLADVVPYRHLDPVRVMVSDWEAENRNEPFWRGSSLAVLPELLADAGFTEIEEMSLGEAPFFYPWVTMARAGVDQPIAHEEVTENIDIDAVVA